MTRVQEDRLMGVIAVFISLCIAMIGFYLLQFSPGSIPGWLMTVGGLLLFVKANSFTKWQYRHFPDKEWRLVKALVVLGVIVALAAFGLEADIKITPLRMTFAVFGILLVLSGAYL